MTYADAYRQRLVAEARRAGAEAALAAALPDVLTAGEAAGWAQALRYLDTVDAVVSAEAWAYREPPDRTRGLAPLVLWALEVAAEALAAEAARRFGDDWPAAVEQRRQP